MSELFHELGADEPAFAIDIAAGPTAASPHAVPGDRVVQEGDLVLVDAGASARPLLLRLHPHLRRRRRVRLAARDLRRTPEAQQAGLDAVRAGTTGREADAAARAVIVDAGYGENFGHGLGHGLGLMVHEAPTLRPSRATARGRQRRHRRAGHLPERRRRRPDRGLVVVTDDGCEMLTDFTKELLTDE